MTSAMTHAAGRPQTNEYAPYYERYISLVSGDDIDHTLSAQLPDTLALLARFTEQQGVMPRGNGPLKNYSAT